MPTLQTTPYMSWIFPDEAYAMNRKGVQELQEVRVPTLDAMTKQDDTHTHFSEYARREALARIENSKLKEAGMLGHRNTTERSQRYERPASRSSVKNGVFHDMAPGVYTQGNAYRGGTGLITKEGREWVVKRLAQRIQELNAIDTQNYSAGPPVRVYVEPKYNEIDTILATFLDEFESGIFTAGLVEGISKIQLALLNLGTTIDEDKLAELATIVGRLQVQADRIIEEGAKTAEYAVKGEKKDILKIVSLGLDRIQKLIEDINRVVNESKSSRELVMKNISRQILPSVAKIAAPFGVKTLVKTERGIKKEKTKGTTEQRRRRVPQAALEGTPKKLEF